MKESEYDRIMKLGEFEYLRLKKENDPYAFHRAVEMVTKLLESDEPYFGWCDVDGCEEEGYCGGSVWRKTGYWTVCLPHFNDYTKGRPQPDMKQAAIKRENTRDKKTGYLK